MASNRTIGHDKDDRPKVSITSRSYNPRENNQVSFTGLDSREIELIEGAAHGHHWISVSHLGRLRAIPTYKELPGPMDDEMMLPFWRPAVMGIETQLELFDFAPKPVYYSPSITIQHLCGYNYSAENYRRQAINLQQWGFECLRSRRNDAGQYHEIWVLPGTWSAEGKLKEVINAVEQGDRLENRRVDAAIRFLCSNVMFGTLDVSAQRVALSAE